jgi:hypothetical protein
MFRTPKPVLSCGAVAVPMGILMLAAPRAAHAVAATLVQVTNTAANPAITQSAPTQAAQLVNLAINVGGSFSPVNLFALAPDGTSSLGYTVPSGQYLVITGADIGISTFSPPTGVCAAQSWSSAELLAGGIYKHDWTVTSVATAHFDYPSGLPIGPGLTVQVLTACGANIELQGYLTSN